MYHSVLRSPHAPEAWRPRPRPRAARLRARAAPAPDAAALLHVPLTPAEAAAPPARVCVTGAGGYVAGSVVQRLLAAGHTGALSSGILGWQRDTRPRENQGSRP